MSTEIDEILYYEGENPENWFQAIVPPIFQTSNFHLRNVAEFREKIQDEMSHYLYTRGNNPTVHILRQKIAALEGMEDALVFSSGSAAMSAAVASLIKQGDHILCVSKPYTWTRKFLEQWLPRFGVETSWFDGTQLEDVKQKIKPNTRLIVLESPNSLTFELQDLKSIANMAHDRGIFTVLDNSYATPLYQQAGPLGIDLSVHSATKYLNGHSDVVAGVVAGSKKLIKQMFSQEYMMWGAICSPYEASMILRGLRTLPIRLQRSSETALFLAHKLEQHPKVQSVLHPHLPSFPQYELAKQQMKGCGGLFSILLKTTEESSLIKFSDALSRFKMAASWGGYESLQMPMVAFASYNNSQLPMQLVRLYAGLEDPNFLWQDLEQALEKI
jgi:cystathionine beta-lyase